MQKTTRRIWFAATVAALAAGGFQLARAQQPEQKTAEQVYKNITQLKGVPADQLIPTMQFMSTSLGVNCEFCHVQKREADDKPAKKTAREMIAMTKALNHDDFNGSLTISCYSCHRGSEHPVGVPPVMTSDAPARPEGPRPGMAMAERTQGGPAAGPPPETAGAMPPRMDPAANAAAMDQLIEKYVQASGGADALKKFTSRVETGTMTAGGNSTPVEISEAAGKRAVVSRGPNGENFTVSTGTSGWSGSTGRPTREMSSDDAWSTIVGSDFGLPLRLKEFFPQLRRGRPEEIDGAATTVVMANAPGKPQARLWFDSNTGLLVRMLLLADTPVGRIPTQIDYADFRDVDGVKMPFRITTSGTNRRSTVQIAGVKTNVPVAETLFTQPAEAAH
jgi:photosynthetic reaction center cytochrome c subunit